MFCFGQQQSLANCAARVPYALTCKEGVACSGAQTGLDRGDYNPVQELQKTRVHNAALHSKLLELHAQHKADMAAASEDTDADDSDGATEVRASLFWLPASAPCVIWPLRRRTPTPTELPPRCARAGFRVSTFLGVGVFSWPAVWLPAPAPCVCECLCNCTCAPLACSDLGEVDRV